MTHGAILQLSSTYKNQIERSANAGVHLWSLLANPRLGRACLDVLPRLERSPNLACSTVPSAAVSSSYALRSGRFGRVNEFAGAAVFLASEAASFVNGEVLVVDGGFLASGVNQMRYHGAHWNLGPPSDVAHRQGRCRRSSTDSTR